MTRARNYFDVLAELAVLAHLEHNAQALYRPGLEDLTLTPAQALAYARDMAVGGAVRAYVIGATVLPAPHRRGGMGMDRCPKCDVEAVFDGGCFSCGAVLVRGGAIGGGHG